MTMHPLIIKYIFICRNHWALLALHPHKGFVYWIDPLHGQHNGDVELLVDL